MQKYKMKFKNLKINAYIGRKTRHHNFFLKLLIYIKINHKNFKKISQKKIERNV
jgi:hypothetical protein